MPLRRGISDTILSGNIREFHKGGTYARTAAKFGKARADKQAVAVAFAKRHDTILKGKRSGR